jgi:hypothetical protein
MLIWNDPLSSTDLSMVLWLFPEQASACSHKGFRPRVGRGVPGAPKAPPQARSPGRHARHVVRRRVGDRAAETTDDRGRFDDESR